MPGSRAPLRERFAAKVEQQGECLVWIAGTNSAGYGHIGLGGRKGGREYAHRLAYMWAHDLTELPRGYHVDHLCRNTRCVNPDHLELVTHGENIRRGNEHNRMHGAGRYRRPLTDRPRHKPRPCSTLPGVAHVRVTKLADTEDA